MDLKEKKNNLLFTNHDAVGLPFLDNSADVSIFCNTMHHMPTHTHLELLLENLYRVGKKSVIIEIEKPSKTGLFPHLLNKYWYMGFLKDVGGAYLEEQEFQTIVKSAAKDKNVEFSSFKNIQGKYMIAVVE